MLGIKIVLFIYAIFAWSLLIPATKLVIDAANTSSCIDQNYANITMVLDCIETGPNWEAAMITIAILLFLHNSMLTLAYVADNCRRPTMPLQSFRNKDI